MTGSSVEPPGRFGLGLATSDVRLSPYDPDWVVLGARECATVRALLGDLVVDVMHAGSTAVPGIAAKPILDIVAAVGDSVPIDEVVGRLCTTGAYSYEGDQGDDGGLLLVRGPGELRTVHVHVVGAGSQAWVDYRRFRTLLLTDVAARGALRVGQASAGPAVPARPPGVHPGQGPGDPGVAGRPGAVDGVTDGLIRT